MHFDPNFDLGNIITIIIALAGLYAAGRNWTKKVEDKFQEVVNRLGTVEGKQSDQAVAMKVLSAKAETIEGQIANQGVVMIRMETSVVDPLRRFASLEAEHSNMIKDNVKLATHMQDLEKRIDEQGSEIKSLRQRIHDLSGAAQVRANTEAISRLNLTPSVSG